MLGKCITRDASEAFPQGISDPTKKMINIIKKRLPLYDIK